MCRGHKRCVDLLRRGKLGPQMPLDRPRRRCTLAIDTVEVAKSRASRQWIYTQCFAEAAGFVWAEQRFLDIMLELYCAHFTATFLMTSAIARSGLRTSTT